VCGRRLASRFLNQTLIVELRLRSKSQCSSIQVQSHPRSWWIVHIPAYKEARPFPRWVPPLRRSDLSIAPRCPVIPSLHRSDLSARCARGPSGAGNSYGVPVATAARVPIERTLLTEYGQFHRRKVGGIPRVLTRSHSWWWVHTQPTRETGRAFESHQRSWWIVHIRDDSGDPKIRA